MTRTAKQTRLLLADEPSSLDRLKRAFSSYHCFDVSTLQQAELLLEQESVHLFVIGVHLDDSRSMELISTIRTNETYKHFPILVVRLMPSEHTEMLRATLGMMIKLKVVSEYLELDPETPNDPGKLRRTVDNLLNEKRAEIGAARK
ncbi:MAG: hypothetical protein ACRD3W_06905 [Terriglobales bacterium]